MSLAQFNLEIAEIRDDRTRGASELARRCLTLLATAAQTLRATDAATLQGWLLDLAAELEASRPSMAPIQNLLNRWRAQFSNAAHHDLRATRQHAIAHAEQLIAASQQAVTECAAHAVQLLGARRTLMTHSFSSTVLEVCRQLKDSGLKMIVTESRPLEEGRRLAEQFSAWSVPTVYITDAQMHLFVAQADAVLVGADSVLADGTVVNKAGTALLALAARAQATPFYVCCESFKWRPAGSAAPVLEEMAATELGVPAWPKVTVRNLYFDLTPARLVNAWISETGIRQPNPRQ